MNAKELLNLLLESSSLRTDLLNEVGGILKNLLDNIELTDEIVARVNQETYEFIKSYKR